jgi:hypothetical protein
MTTYRQLATKDLKGAGISVASLVEQYPQELMRFKLACDMGMTDIELKDDEAGSHPLNRAAEAWIELATAWPAQEAIASIAVPALDKAIVFKISEGINVLAQLPLSLHTEVIRLAAVQEYGLSIKYIHSDQQSETVRLASVQQRGWAIKYIPAAEQSETVRLAAVLEEGMGLQFIPANQQSEVVRLAAVQQNGMALQFIPADQQSEAVRLAAVKKDGAAFRYISSEMQSRAVRLAALMADKSSSSFMPPQVAKKLLAELANADGMSPV